MNAKLIGAIATAALTCAITVVNAVVEARRTKFRVPAAHPRETPVSYTHLTLPTILLV